MQIEKISDKLFLATITILELEELSISKENFMTSSEETKFLLNQIKEDAIYLFNLKNNLKESNTYLIDDTFFIYLKTEIQNYEFTTEENFLAFCNFISQTKYANDFYYDSEKKEISISQDISNDFFYLLNEFTN